MESKIKSFTKRPVVFLIFWFLLLFAATILSVFLHEVGHGIGAKIERIHVSTGFNQVGDYGKSPDDPDFRSETNQENIMGGLLGPIITWVLAILCTVWLYRFKTPSWQAVAVGALAIAGGLIRAIPMMSVLLSDLMQTPRLEDEVGWGIWAVLKFCKPAYITPGLDYHSILSTYPGVFLSEWVFWALPLLSLAIVSICLILAYRKLVRLLRRELKPVLIWLACLLPLIAYYSFKPLQDVLDQLIRINW